MTDESTAGETAVLLQPERDLDILVAQAIGWEWNDETAYSPSGGRWARRPGDDWLPHYSTDLTAAMEVWETLPKPRTMSEDDEGWLVICGGGSYLYEIHDPEYTHLGAFRAKGDTAAHAICLAALKAVEPSTPL